MVTPADIWRRDYKRKENVQQDQLGSNCRGPDDNDLSGR